MARFEWGMQAAYGEPINYSFSGRTEREAEIAAREAFAEATERAERSPGVFMLPRRVVRRVVGEWEEA